MSCWFKLLALVSLLVVVVSCEEEFTEEDLIASLLGVMKEVGISEGTLTGIEKIAVSYKPQLRETRIKDDNEAGKAVFEKMSAEIDAYVAKASKADQEAHKKFVEKVKAQFAAQNQDQ
ncbi:unnamed protein product [Caenorhabditis auriculariae]|uniref:Uncharacterized protein n=1 Tax=Caenorhabditis auriculariae TaxID=2777116 RepID=A0A8S1HAY6_9PELO|nr:unnamed protein product [Caenorhabditis auriculariae]